MNLNKKPLDICSRSNTEDHIIRDRKTQPTEFYPPKFGLFLPVFKHIFQSMKNPDSNGDFDEKCAQKKTP